MKNKIFFWITVATLIILAVPLIAMQFSENVKWTLSDFVIAGLLLFAAGSIFILAARKFPKRRVAVEIAIALVFIWLWAELAVGVFTNWGS